MAEGQLTRVQVEFVTPEPYVGDPEVTYNQGYLSAGEDTITLTKEVEEGAAVLVFLSGVNQSEFTVEGDKVILPEQVEVEMPYTVVFGNLLQRTNVPTTGTMAVVNQFTGTETPDDSMGSDGDWYIQEDEATS